MSRPRRQLNLDDEQDRFIWGVTKFAFVAVLVIILAVILGLIFAVVFAVKALAVEDSTPGTTEVFWVTPPGSTPQHVGWPQDLLGVDLTEIPCGPPALIQVDTYPDDAVAALIADSRLDEGEDSDVVISWRWAYREACVEASPSPSPEPSSTPSPTPTPEPSVTPSPSPEPSPTPTPTPPTEECPPDALACTGAPETWEILAWVSGGLLAAGAITLMAVEGLRPRRTKEEE